jgi:hypothetical protein
MPEQTTLFDDPEGAARDLALDRIEWTRPRLVHRGRALALELCERYGRVTSVMVMEALKNQAAHDPGLAAEIDGADPRWLGAVFRVGYGWVRVGWSRTGSHKRPVPIWGRKQL